MLILGEGLCGKPINLVQSSSTNKQWPPDENRQRPCTQIWLYQGSQPPPLVLGRGSNAGRGEEKLSSEKREGFGYALIKVVGMGKLEPGYPEASILRDWLQENIWLSLVVPKLEVETQIREARVIEQVLAAMG